MGIAATTGGMVLADQILENHEGVTLKVTTPNHLKCGKYVIKTGCGLFGGEAITTVQLCCYKATYSRKIVEMILL